MAGLYRALRASSSSVTKAHEPRDHKNTPSVNNLLKIIKHLVRIEPLKLPSGLPAEEDMANTCLNSRGAGGETSPETT
ncbi:39S ribosomal protein L30, mitochondrial-like [Carassius auratus]|uniref:39S ribosomal protein L30, mitochondrial-like n=1 Tax=Carassius auratus TaxID=7957 RepID=A0A6P6KP87_CARAU|nr:39S ribosomal protein L30, mitochondrial-like [Carassius auratus]